MIDRMGDSLARLVYRHDQGRHASLDELEYGISHALNTFVPAALALMVSAVFGFVGEALLGMITFAVLRSLTGGFHFKNAIACALVTTALLASIPYMDYKQCHYVYNFVATILIICFAPCKIESQNNLRPKYRPLLKMVAILAVALNYIIGSDLMSTAFLVQSVTIISLTRKEEAPCATQSQALQPKL